MIIVVKLFNLSLAKASLPPTSSWEGVMNRVSTSADMVADAQLLV